MSVIRKRVAPIVIELIKKTDRQGTHYPNGQSWKKIPAGNIIRNHWTNEICDRIHGEDHQGGYYEIAEFQNVNRQC